MSVMACMLFDGDGKSGEKELAGVTGIIKNNIIIIIRTFPECFAPEKFQCKIT